MAIGEAEVADAPDTTHLSMETAAVLDHYRRAIANMGELALEVRPMYWFQHKAGCLIGACANGAVILHAYGPTADNLAGSRYRMAAEILHVSEFFITGCIHAFDGYGWEPLYPADWIEGYKVGAILRSEYHHGNSPTISDQETAYE